MRYVEPKIAYQKGKDARRKGWERLSPYYNQPQADKYFYAGWDGKPFEEVK